MAKVLFVCRQNAGRSQMSEAFFHAAAHGGHQAKSAGTAPASEVHPVVRDVMREVGLDLDGRQPQRLSPELSEWADIIVTMGCGDECPFVPGKRYLDWDLADPAGRPAAAVRPIRDDIRRRVQDLIRTLG